MTMKIWDEATAFSLSEHDCLFFLMVGFGLLFLIVKVYNIRKRRDEEEDVSIWNQAQGYFRKQSLHWVTKRGLQHNLSNNARCPFKLALWSGLMESQEFPPSDYRLSRAANQAQYARSTFIYATIQLVALFINWWEEEKERATLFGKRIWETN